MNAWRRYVRACRTTAGVGTRAGARDLGVHPTTWSRCCDREGWARPYPGVAVAPWAGDVDAAVLAAVAAAHGGVVGGATARWRHGRGRRPRRFEVLIGHGRSVRAVTPDPVVGDLDDLAAAERAARRAEVAERRRWHGRCRRVGVRRCRWLQPSDGVLVGGVPTLTPVATAIDLAATDPDEVRAFLVDAQHAGELRLPEVRERLRDVGPVRGRHVLVAALDALEGRRPESIFLDEVLTAFQRRGYRPDTRPRRIATPRGRTVTPDIPLAHWKVAIEVDGDRFHRDREARRRDRERLSAYASTDWTVVVVDHRTWTQDRERVFGDVDAAIAAQRRRRIGADVEPPRRDRPHVR